MHLQNFKTRGEIALLLRHDERAKDPRHKEHSRQNESIDPERTPLNYSIIDRGNALQYINERIEGVRHLNRADVTQLSELVVSLPIECPNKDAKAFFTAVTETIAERYGSKNIAYSIVHLDETTPHAHIGIIPIAKDKQGREHLSRKEVFPRAELRKMHPEIERETNKKLLERGIKPVHLLNGRTEINPLTKLPYEGVRELKRQAEREERQLPKDKRGRTDYKAAYLEERTHSLALVEEIKACKQRELQAMAREQRAAERAEELRKCLQANQEQERELLHDPERLARLLNNLTKERNSREHEKER